MFGFEILFEALRGTFLAENELLFRSRFDNGLLFELIDFLYLFLRSGEKFK
jgi:hypothetical protein